MYPKLRDYCKKTYGLEFQVYDMRWGISHEITSSHMTTTVCLNEIKNCQKYSAGPNFIVNFQILSIILFICIILFKGIFEPSIWS